LDAAAGVAGRGQMVDDGRWILAADDTTTLALFVGRHQPGV